MTPTDKPPRVYCEARLEHVERPAPRVLRATLVGDGLVGYLPVRPAEAFRLLLPPPGVSRIAFPQTGADGLPTWPDERLRPMLRGFTVRHVGGGSITFDVMERDDVLWRSRLQPGRTVGVAGMRFGYHAADAAGHHVLVGDRSALPAISASLDGVPDGQRCTVVLAVADPAERALLPDRPHTTVRWAEQDRLASVLATELADTPPDHVLAAGEVAVVAAAHSLVTDAYGLPASRVQPIVYWQRGIGADERDPRIYQRYQQAARDGRDVGDPARVAELELTPV